MSALNNNVECKSIYGQSCKITAVKIIAPTLPPLLLIPGPGQKEKVANNNSEVKGWALCCEPQLYVMR